MAAPSIREDGGDHIERSFDFQGWIFANFCSLSGQMIAIVMPGLPGQARP